MKGQTDNLQHPLSLKTRYWHKNCDKSQSPRKRLKPLTLLLVEQQVYSRQTAEVTRHNNP